MTEPASNCCLHKGLRKYSVTLSLYLFKSSQKIDLLSWLHKHVKPKEWILNGPLIFAYISFVKVLALNWVLFNAHISKMYRRTTTFPFYLEHLRKFILIPISFYVLANHYVNSNNVPHRGRYSLNLSLQSHKDWKEFKRHKLDNFKTRLPRD